MGNAKQPLPPLWLTMWALLLSAAWLLPNHYFPWGTFHTDSWVAIMMAVAAAGVLARTSLPVNWHGLPTLFAAIAFIPFLQYAGGLLAYSGQAWLATAYAVGLVLALLIGSHWEAASSDEAIDGLFLAIGIAALVSVGLQIAQWLDLFQNTEEIQVWAQEYSLGRPAANLGQPNQLATLLMWGIVAMAWGVLRAKIRPVLALVATLYLIFGVVLTQSRMAVVALIVATAVVWIWRRLLPRQVPWIASGLLVYFLLATWGLQYVNVLFGLDFSVRPSDVGASTNLRLEAYRLFLDALGHRPWLGFGWSQLPTAQLLVSELHPNMTGVFAQSHNLFLDLLLWFGIPLGAFVSISLLAWFAGVFMKARQSRDVILGIFLLVVGVHAMVELPLHHAYFLLPVGLVAGVLNQRLGFRVYGSIGRVTAAILLVAASALLVLIMRDYLKVEENFRAFRLEMNNVGGGPPAKVPEVLVLNDMQAFVGNLRSGVRPDVTPEERENRRRLALAFPTPSNLFGYVLALAYTGQVDEAQLWIAKMQKVQPVEYLDKLEYVWNQEGRTHPAIARVPWVSIKPKPSVAPPPSTDATRTR